MNMHAVRSKYLQDPAMSLQSLFEKVSSHNAAEDSRGYQTLFAKLIESMLFTSWTPDISVPAIGTPQSQRRAGYLIEFAARKIVNSREKKRVLFELADALRAAVDKAPHTTLYPNPAQNQYSMERNTDQLAREWGLLDGATRSNILKMIKAVVPV